MSKSKFIEDPILGKYRIEIEPNAFNVQMRGKIKGKVTWYSKTYHSSLQAAVNKIAKLKHLDDGPTTMTLKDYIDSHNKSVETIMKAITIPA